LSVYTPVSQAELSAWLRGYSVGALETLEPIPSGIENTNYFVTTTQGRYVLTLFERLPAAELPFYLDLMAHLARHGIPCPAPIASLDDAYLGELNGKPAALVTRLPGRSLERPGAHECAELGALLARMHLAGRSYGAYLENPRGPRWWRRAARDLQPFLDTGQKQLLAAELAFQAGQRFPDLPRGPVHADLFRDNALFDGGRLSGVFDFYFAGVDCLLYDVAVCANDWCLADPRSDRRLEPARVQALLGAYHALRPFASVEQAAWPAMLRAAALRFWLSRLHDLHLPRPGELVHAHDPAHFGDILALRIAQSPPWLGAP
jgi:homoserine kinase type II